MRIHHRDLRGSGGPGGGAVSSHRILEGDGGDHDPEGDPGCRLSGGEVFWGRLGRVRGPERCRG